MFSIIQFISYFSLWIKHYVPRYVKVHGSDIEEQLISTKTMDHEVYTACVRRPSQMDQENNVWSDSDCSRVFLEPELSVSLLFYFIMTIYY